jgi:hypothetical protein
MIKDHSPGSGRTLTFVSGKPGFSAAAFASFIVALAIATLATGENTARALAGLVIFACILFAAVTRRWIAEIDLEARRLKVSRRVLGRWTRTIVDCPLDECRALGTFEYETDGPPSYNVYVELRDGTRHTIPLTDSTLNEAARLASQLSAATGIPRLDIYLGPTYIRPDDTTSRRDR